jgi:hypothetical protein
MTTYAWPVGFTPNALRFTQMSRNLKFTSAVSGGQEMRALAPAKWMVNITMPVKKNNREFAAFLMKLEGGLHYFTMYDFTRREPRGTMRGTLTLSSAASVGASSLVITGGAGQANRTLLAGDWLQCGNQLFMVVDNATANGSGVITVNVKSSVRTALSSGSSVIWDKPVCTYQLNSSENGFDVLNVGFIGEISLDATEVIA